MIRDVQINALIAVRGGSKRVPRKNIRPFADTTMLENKIKQCYRIENVEDVIVTSDDDEMLEIAYNLGATVSKRDPHYASDAVPMGDVYEHLASNLDCKDILWLPVTSPLVRDETIQECIEIYKNNLEHDSVATVSLMKEYLWQGKKAINYDSKNHPRSQDLPDIYALNFAANLLPRQTMIKNKSILGNSFYPLMIDKFESIDVDTKEDFVLAEMLFKERDKIFCSDFFTI